MDTELQIYTEEDFEFILDILNDYAEQNLNKGEFQDWHFQEIRYYDDFFHIFFVNSWTIGDSITFEYSGPLFQEDSLHEKWFALAIQSIKSWENEMIY